MESGSELGDFLRAQREIVLPEDVGLPSAGRRRARGLRREEAASLAGISADHYLQLEQGSELHPTDAVLDGLAAALRLSAEAIVVLRTLARPSEAERGESRESGESRGSESAPPALVDLITAWPNQAAFIQGRLMDVLAANRLAAALSPLFHPGTNGLRAAFLDPAVRDLYRDWEGMLAHTVAGLRALIGPDVLDPKLAQLVGELSVRSEEFRTIWADHHVRLPANEMTLLKHPRVGLLDLNCEKFAISDSDGQTLVILHAAPGSDSETGFRRLASLVAGGLGDAERPLTEPVSIESKRRQV